MKGSELIIKLYDESALAREGGASWIAFGRGIFLSGFVNSLSRCTPDVATGTEIGFVTL